ncbi:MAG TPA: hypothetical protein VGP47_05160 [Parachlamydiaceae bacterium]|nr:hypothetical protein [Parachlamydiaceae bacterium]
MGFELSLNTKQASTYLAQQAVKTAVVGATGAAMGMAFRVLTGSPAFVPGFTTSQQFISDAFVPVALQASAVVGNIMNKAIEKSGIDLGNWKGDRMTAVTGVTSLVIADRISSFASHSALLLSNYQTLGVGVGAWLAGSIIYYENVASKKVTL